MQRKTVLVAEPNARSRSALRRDIEQLGYSVTEAGDGASALRGATRSEVTLVVAELYLACGEERCVVRAIGRAPGLRRTKLLVYTEHGSDADRSWALNAGADAYLVKGEGPGMLLQAVGRLASSRSPARRALRGGGAS